MNELNITETQQVQGGAVTTAVTIVGLIAAIEPALNAFHAIKAGYNDHRIHGL